MSSRGTIRIRRATLHDLDVLVHQRREMWREIGDHTDAELDEADHVYRRWARQRLRSGTLVGWVAETRDRRVVAGGCVWLQEIQPRPGRTDRVQPYLLSMYTEPGARGRGLASHIVREALRWAKARGHARMTLHAADLGRGVYERLGFTRTWEMRYRLAGGRAPSRARAKPRAPRRSSEASRRRGPRGTRARS